MLLWIGARPLMKRFFEPRSVQSIVEWMPLAALDRAYASADRICRNGMSPTLLLPSLQPCRCYHPLSGNCTVPMLPPYRKPRPRQSRSVRSPVCPRDRSRIPSQYAQAGSGSEIQWWWNLIWKLSCRSWSRWVMCMSNSYQLILATVTMHTKAIASMYAQHRLVLCLV